MRKAQFYKLVARSIAVVAVGANLIIAPAHSVTSMRNLHYVEGKDPAAPLFNPIVVNRVDLMVPQSSIDIINSEYPVEYNAMWWRATNFSYVPAKLKITTATKTYGPIDVEIHLKGGWGSLRSLGEKAGFKVKINSTGNKDQRLLGLKKLTFNNDVQDGSYVHEATAYRLFRNVGVPAPRVGYARIYMNCAPDMNPEQNSTCIDYGLHPNIETMDEVALARWVNGTTHLYEGGTPYFPDIYNGAVLQTDLGDPTDTSDFRELAQINQLDGADWYNAMLAHTDLKEMTLEWATETYVGHWDGYAANNNNFYLHSDSNGKFRMFPWGTDQTWGGLQDLYVEDGWGPSTMVAKCNAYAPCREMYAESLVTIWAKAEAINLARMPRDIYSGILASSMGPQSDPFSGCNVYCANANAEGISNFLKSRSDQISPLATSFALVAPELAATPTTKTITMSWVGKKVPGVPIKSYQVQQSIDENTWVSLKLDSPTKTVIRNVTPGRVFYYRVRAVTSRGTTPWSPTVRVQSK